MTFGYRQPPPVGITERPCPTCRRPEPICGCGHPERDHFPACLAEVQAAPRVEFASDIYSGRRHYICTCPAFGSPAGQSIGRRRARAERAQVAAR